MQNLLILVQIAISVQSHRGKRLVTAYSFSELTRDFTQERRRRIAEMKGELLTEAPQHDLHRGHLGIREVDPDISGRPQT